MKARVQRSTFNIQRALADGGRRSAAIGQGFSVVEVLIAVSILAVSLLAIASMFPVGYQDIEYSGRMTIAAELARQKLEELRNTSFSSLASSSSPENLSGGFTRSWTVVDAGVGAQAADLKQVTVTVTWQGFGRPSSLSMTTLIAKP